MSFYESHRRQPSIPTAQARLQGLQADPQTLAHALAGSKKLYNIFDSVFAIGKSAIDRIITDYHLASTGKRIKDETIPGRINWLHTTLKRRHLLPKDWQLTQCLFGEHLLPQHPDIDAYHDWLIEFLQDNK